MKNKKNNNNNSNTIKLLAIGATLAGLATTYFFLSPRGIKQLTKAKSWAIKMKGDVIEKLEQAREVSEEVYNKIIDSVATKYEKNSKYNPDEIRSLAEDLRKYWPSLSLCLSKESNKRNVINKKSKKEEIKKAMK